MSEPNKCKWCGLHENWHIDNDTVFACGTINDTVFACGTIWDGRVDVWNQSTGCVEIMAQRNRIQRALETLKAAKRHDFVVNFLSSMLQCDDGEFVEFEAVDQAIQILESEED